MARATFTDNTAPDSPTRTESRFRPAAATSRTDLLTVKNLTDALSRQTSQILLPINSNTLGDRPNTGTDFRRHDIRVEPESGGTEVFLDITDGIFALSRPLRNRFHNTTWEPQPTHRMYLGYDTDGNPLPNGPYYFFLNYGENNFSNSLINPGDTRATFVINGVSEDYTGFLVDDDALLDIATGSRMTVNLPVTIYEGRATSSSDTIDFTTNSTGVGVTNQEMNIWRLQNNNSNSHLRMTVNTGYYANRDLSFRLDNNTTFDIPRFPTSNSGGVRWNAVTHEWQVGHNVSTRDVLYRGSYIYWRAVDGPWAAPTEGGFISDNGIRLILRNNLTSIGAGVDVPRRSTTQTEFLPLNFGRYGSVFNMQVLTSHPVLGGTPSHLAVVPIPNTTGLYLHENNYIGGPSFEDAVGLDNGRVLIDMQAIEDVPARTNDVLMEQTMKVVFRNLDSVSWADRWAVRNGRGANLRPAIFEHQTEVAGQFLDFENNPISGARVRLNMMHPSYYPDEFPGANTSFLAFDTPVSALAVTDSEGNFAFRSSNGLLFNERATNQSAPDSETDVAVVVEAIRLADRFPDDEDVRADSRTHIAQIVDYGYQAPDTRYENNVRYRHNATHGDTNLSVFAFGFKFVTDIVVQLPRCGHTTGDGTAFEGLPVFELPRNLERDLNLSITEPRRNEQNPAFPAGSPGFSPNLVSNTQALYDAVYSEAFRQGIENPLTIVNGQMRIASGMTLRLENLRARQEIVEFFNNIISVSCDRTLSSSTLTDAIIGALETPSVTLNGVRRTTSVTSTDFEYSVLNYTPDYTISMYTAEEGSDGVVRINNFAPFFSISNRANALDTINGIVHPTPIDTLSINRNLPNFPNGSMGVSQNVSFGTGTGQTQWVVLVAGSPTGGVYKRIIDTRGSAANLSLDLSTTPQRPNTVDIPTGWTVETAPLTTEISEISGIPTTDSRHPMLLAEVLSNYSTSGWNAPTYGVNDFQPWVMPISFTAVPESTMSLTDAQTAALFASVRDDPIFLEWIAFIIDPNTNGTTDFFYPVGGRNAYVVDPALVQLRVGSGVDSSRVIGLGYMDRINSVDPTAAIADYNLVGNIIVAAEPSALSTEAVAETFQVSEQNIENAVDSAINASGLVTNTDLVRARNTIIGNL